MDDAEMRVQFAPPERTPTSRETAVIAKMKNDFIEYLWAGEDESTAAVKAGTSLKDILWLRKSDAAFDQRVKNQLRLIREEHLPEIEANIFAMAKDPTVAGANLGLRVAERLAPDEWGKPVTKGKQEPTRSSEKFEFSEWFESPTLLEADFKSIGDGHDE